ncbi:hypothetical protein CC86DRAFT_450832 [Ophiobolus disseminans]|uniref:Mid2 domain-containing protein n=1 Tax=Ophiobolus disseminans TaxID=1469910 RepID=A0A6A7AJX4_9PLEO|nr:hypothetical protein CC86DRAFT_450832 [Ophiobolus disseminans]
MQKRQDPNVWSSVLFVYSINPFSLTLWDPVRTIRIPASAGPVQVLPNLEYVTANTIRTIDNVVYRLEGTNPLRLSFSGVTPATPLNPSTSPRTIPGSSTTQAGPSSVSTATTSSASNLESNGSVDDGSKTTPKLGGGAIAGIAIGGILSLVLVVVGLYFFLRRRKRAKANAIAANSDFLNGRESDKFVVDPTGNTGHTTQKGGNTQSAHQELSGFGHTQELGTSQAYIGAKSAHELKGHAQPGELPHTRELEGQVGATRVFNSGTDAGMVPAEHAVTAVPSAHVQAQKKRELEWLESEEARLRQQREILMHQTGTSGQTFNAYDYKKDMGLTQRLVFTEGLFGLAKALSMGGAVNIECMGCLKPRSPSREPQHKKLNPILHNNNVCLVFWIPGPSCLQLIGTHIGRNNQ